MIEKNGFNLIKKKFNIQNSEDVKSANKRYESLHNEKGVQKPEEKIERYFERFQEILDREDVEEKQRGISAFKKILFKDIVINTNDISDKVYELDQKMVFDERGVVVKLDSFKGKNKKK